jgi:uncharacterized Zn-finger protein
MLTHTGVKDNICPVCSRGFALASNLKQHMLHHSGRKDLVCDVCNKGFAHDRALRRHKLTHEKKTSTDEEIFVYNNSGRMTTDKMKREPDTETVQPSGSHSLTSQRASFQLQNPAVSDRQDSPFALIGRTDPQTSAVISSPVQGSSGLDLDEEQGGKKSKTARVCDVCNKAFKSAWNLKRHKLTHR